MQLPEVQVPQAVSTVAYPYLNTYCITISEDLRLLTTTPLTCSYCECFAGGLYCQEECGCVECNNTQEYEVTRGKVSGVMVTSRRLFWSLAS